MILEMNRGENKSLSEIQKINAGNINPDAYFLSLTDNALDAGLLTDKNIEDIQYQIYDILSDNICMYTGGASSSVTSKEANELMLSVLSVLDAFCMSEAGDLTGLIKMLKEKAGIKKCYEKGLKLLNKTSAKEIDTFAGEIHKTFGLYDEIIGSDEFKAFEDNQILNDTENQILSQSTMTDAEFNQLYAGILKCRTAEKKAAMIIKSVSSAGDFIDILNAECLFGDEYLALYKKLSEESPETILFLSGNLENSDDEWQKYLIEFIENNKNS